MTNEDKFMKNLKGAAERRPAFSNADLPAIRWELQQVEVSPVPVYPNLTYVSFLADEDDENDYVLKLGSVATPSIDLALRNAVMLPVVLMSRLHNSTETICKVIGTLLQTEQFLMFKEWKSKDIPGVSVPFIIRVHSDKTERIGEDDGFMYYVSVHIELEPERHAQVCNLYAKIFENVFASQMKGLQQ